MVLDILLRRAYNVALNGDKKTGLNRSKARHLNEQETPCRCGACCWVGVADGVYCVPCLIQNRGKVGPVKAV